MFLKIVFELKNKIQFLKTRFKKYNQTAPSILLQIWALAFKISYNFYNLCIKHDTFEKKKKCERKINYKKLEKREHVGIDFVYEIYKK